MMDEMMVVRVLGVSRRFDRTLARREVDLDIPAGQLVGLLGLNGAGKSTLLQLITGLRRPSAGRVELFGQVPTAPAARTRLGSTPQETGLPAPLRVGEIAEFVARHYPDPEPTAPGARCCSPVTISRKSRPSPSAWWCSQRAGCSPTAAWSGSGSGGAVHGHAAGG